MLSFSDIHSDGVRSMRETISSAATYLLTYLQITLLSSTLVEFMNFDSALDNTLAWRAKGIEFESRRADMLCRLLFAPCIARCLFC